PQGAEVADAMVRIADAGKPGRHQILGRIRCDVGRYDREGRDLAEIALEILEPELHVRTRLFARLRHMGEGDDAPLAPVRRLAVGARRLLVNAPVAGVRLERLVRGTADRQ